MHLFVYLTYLLIDWFMCLSIYLLICICTWFVHVRSCFLAPYPLSPSHGWPSPLQETETRAALDAIDMPWPRFVGDDFVGRSCYPIDFVTILGGSKFLNSHGGSHDTSWKEKNKHQNKKNVAALCKWSVGVGVVRNLLRCGQNPQLALIVPHVF